MLSLKDASGNTITDTTSVALINPIRYRGYVYDTESGLYYLQSRYYDPTTCRFVNADCYSDTCTGVISTNMFAYCQNNPIMKVDPAGTDSYIFYRRCKSAWVSLIQNQLLAYFYPNKVIIHGVDNASDLAKDWNAMTGNIQCVVILSDADPLDLQFGDGTLISADAVRSFNKKTVGGVILLGCNAGHNDYVGNNLASAFAKKIGNSRPVLASDGTVNYSRTSNYFNNGYMDATFTSTNDTNFQYYRTSNRNNKGWFIYSYSNNKYYYNNLHQKTLTIYDMLDQMTDYMNKYS